MRGFERVQVELVVSLADDLHTDLDSVVTESCSSASSPTSHPVSPSWWPGATLVSGSVVGFFTVKGSGTGAQRGKDRGGEGRERGREGEKEEESGREGEADNLSSFLDALSSSGLCSVSHPSPRRPKESSTYPAGRLRNTIDTSSSSAAAASPSAAASFSSFFHFSSSTFPPPPFSYPVRPISLVVACSLSLLQRSMW